MNWWEEEVLRLKLIYASKAGIDTALRVLSEQGLTSYPDAEWENSQNMTSEEVRRCLAIAKLNAAREDAKTVSLAVRPCDPGLSYRVTRL